MDSPGAAFVPAGGPGPDRRVVRPVPGYRRREPEKSLLHQTIREHLRTFLAETEARNDGSGLPRFVVAEFERYLRCGILAHGFARVRCPACGDESLVAFSCKSRGICPSCTTRRMQGTATHLIDRVLPHVPMRQWVLSLPRWARFLLARDPQLITRTLDLALRAIFARHRLRARRLGIHGARAGAVTFVQRFGSALNLNVHFHAVIPDGVWIRNQGTVRFLALPGPTDEDVRQVLRRIQRRVRAILKPRLAAARDDARAPDALAASQAESVTTLRGKPPEAAKSKRLTACQEGFSLHAGVHLHAHDRQGLAHLCGYGARPPLTQERLYSLPEGKLGYRMKRSLGDGREVLVLEPRELLRRLAALVPPPRSHLVRYHGVFAPASKWRAEVIPILPEPARLPTCPEVTPAAAPPPRDTRPATVRRPPDSRIPWSELLLRVFREDVLACPCGGRRKVLAFINEKSVIEQILSHLGLPTTGPPTAPARLTAHFESLQWQDEVPELQQSLR
ncbi:MAG TPA: transposase [Myxococcales bacterium]|nr:transposase [Myxococcales bacterium]